jgi:hypothetical protein
MEIYIALAIFVTAGLIFALTVKSSKNKDFKHSH